MKKPQNWNTLDFLMNMAFQICNFKHEPQCRVCWRLLSHSTDTLGSSLPGRSLTRSLATHQGAQLYLMLTQVSTPELGRTATGPQAQTTALETVSMQGIKEANIISKYQKCTGWSDKKGACVIKRPQGRRSQAPSEPGGGWWKQVLRPEAFPSSSSQHFQ